MKKFNILFMLIMLIIPTSVKADNIYNIDMDIYIDKYGNAEITEVWDVKADNGSEWYKTMYDLDGANLSNFIVYMDGVKLERKFWKTNETLSEKAGYYGVINTKDGLELCFGKSDMKRHKFTLKYTLSNYIFNTDDSQVLYWTLIPKIKLENFSIDVTSYYSFPDTLDVWGYGYTGYAYVKDGKISMSNENNLHNQYVVLLAKFPLNTFETAFKIGKYKKFNDVYKQAEKGSFNFSNNLIEFIKEMLLYLFYFLMAFIIVWPYKFFEIIVKIFNRFKKKFVPKYGYINNKKINKKSVSMFRDIPCNKDIYYANTLIKLNNFDYKESNILGAIILKWVKYNKISFIDKEGSMFNKESHVIDLTGKPVFDDALETKLFNMMHRASNDGYLDIYEFEKWCKKNYSEFLNLFKEIENSIIDNLKTKGSIRKRINRNECKEKNVMSDQIYNDSVELYGLKKYLEEFSRMDTKEVMEVKLWDEYLMFAYLFGIADKVAKQLKDMYPEIVNQININNNIIFDYDMFICLSHISKKSFNIASNAKVSAAREAARSYSSGGGGFSSGGGGGGSRGGGGSAGGR